MLHYCFDETSIGVEAGAAVKKDQYLIRIRISYLQYYTGESTKLQKR